MSGGYASRGGAAGNSDIEVSVGEDARTGAAANGAVDGGCEAIVGTGTYVSPGADSKVEDNRGDGANRWISDGCDIEKGSKVKFGTGSEWWAEGVVNEETSRVECRFRK